MANVVILAEDAAEVAACKKDCARAAGSDKNAFFSEMRTDGADDRNIRYAAKTDLASAAINFTVAGTDDAGIHTFSQLLNNFAE